MKNIFLDSFITPFLLLEETGFPEKKMIQASQKKKDTTVRIYIDCPCVKKLNSKSIYIDNIKP